MRVGGNTCCVEVRAADADPLIIDAGTGLRKLGDHLLAEAAERHRGVRATLLLSHLHWDHIQGLPFFRPLYRPDTELTVLTPPGEAASRRSALEAEFQSPYFPVAFAQIAARISFREMPTDGMEWQGMRIRQCRLHHPQRAYAFRIDSGGRSLVHALDHEHGNEIADSALAELAYRTDLLVGDAQYTPEEYLARRGWGHSTWRDLIDLARRAEVGRLVLTHHDPWHDDASLATIEREAQAALNHCSVARENWEVTLD